MKYTIIYIILIIQSSLSYGQARHLNDDDYNNSGANQLAFITSYDDARVLAHTDIDKQTPFLLLASGLAPTIYTTDSLFENEFNVYYYELGDVHPDIEIISAYNSVIFDYLSNVYGKKWQRSVRKDVVGYKKWKRNK